MTSKILSGCTAIPAVLVSSLFYATDGPSSTTDYKVTGTQLAAFINASPVITGHATIEGVTITGATGTGNLVFATAPTLTTPILGAATATSINKVAITAPATSATLTIADGKTLTVSNILTLAGTDSTTMTFPTTSATIARTDAAQTFTGAQTFSTAIAVGSGGTGAATLTAHGVLLGEGTSAVAATGAGTAGQILKSGGASADPAFADNVAAITFVIDGGGSVLTTGVKGDLYIPFACTITAATLLADQSGSVVVNIWKVALASYPSTVTNKITASAPPTLSSADHGQTTLTGWTTAIAAGDTLRFNVDSITTITRVTLVLTVTKS